MLEAFLFKQAESNVRHHLSAVTRISSDRGEIVELASDNLDAVRSAFPIPDPLGKRRLLIEHVAGRAPGVGKVVRLDVSDDYPVIFGEDSSEFSYLLKHLIDEGLIETRDQNGVRSYGLSMKGWAEHERIRQESAAPKHAASNGIRDHLTRLLARAAFDTALNQAASDASPETPASLIMADIDHFKRINDEHGHPAGDDVLKEAARRLMLVVAGKGEAYRYGGEEFAVILPNHSADEALAVAERARETLDASPAPTVHVTASYGVATLPLHATAAADWLKRADEALYDAKGRGRNLVRLYGEPAPATGENPAPRRKQASADALSDEAKEALRLEILRDGGALCPRDQTPLLHEDISTMGSMGSDLSVRCPACGLQASLYGPRA